jgi:hypothetical protein
VAVEIVVDNWPRHKGGNRSKSFQSCNTTLHQLLIAVKPMECLAALLHMCTVQLSCTCTAVLRDQQSSVTRWPPKPWAHTWPLFVINMYLTRLIKVECTPV